MCACASWAAIAQARICCADASSATSGRAWIATNPRDASVTERMARIVLRSAELPPPAWVAHRA
jgi:hypothetical protein